MDAQLNLDISNAHQLARAQAVGLEDVPQVVRQVGDRSNGMVAAIAGNVVAPAARVVRRN
jgi:hypothetical protein